MSDVADTGDLDLENLDTTQIHKYMCTHSYTHIRVGTADVYICNTMCIYIYI